MASIDVTVRGAGIFGLTVAHACAVRGARVRVIDPGGPGAGASGGVVGALAPHTPDRWNAKKQFQFEALAWAESYWAEVDGLSGLSSGYARTGRLQPIADDRALELAEERAAAAVIQWQGIADWQVIAAPAGWSPVSPTGRVIRDTLTARLDPAGACHSLASAVLALRGEIAQDGPEDGAVVWAIGAAGLAQLSEALDRPVGAPVKGQAAVLDLDRRDLPQLFADSLHIVPHANGTVAVGSTSEREFADPETTDEQLEDVIERARSVCPALRDAAVLRRWAGLRPRARSRAPILGPWPGRPGHFVANGGFKIGFGLAPKVGALMADLLLEGRADIPEEFSVEANL